VGNNVRRSPTALAQFEKCERQFYYQRIAKLPEAPSPHLCVGILYHNVIEQFVRAGEMHPAVVDEAIRDIRGRPEWCDPGKTGDELCSEIMAAIPKIAALVERLPVVRQGSKPLVEIWGTRYTAKIDYVSTHTPVVEGGRLVDVKPGLCVLDWKTVGGRRRRGQDDADNSAQLALYCIETGAHSAAFVEIPRDGGPLNIVVAEFDDDTLRRWEKFLDAQFGAMQSRGPAEEQFKLAERGHPLCSPRFCTYWDRCPGGAS
jgi:PD-(D/E)XK nuclease superfamily protein